MDRFLEIGGIVSVAVLFWAVIVPSVLLVGWIFLYRRWRPTPQDFEARRRHGPAPSYPELDPVRGIMGKLRRRSS